MNRRNQRTERGSAMLVTLIIIASLLAGAAVLVSMQLSSTRSSDLTRSGMASLYCAEAGLTATRTAVAANRTSWVGNIGTGVEPSWLASIDHDLDGDTLPDFRVTLQDDDDDTDAVNDSNEKIFLVSRCIKYVDTQKVVMELIEYIPVANCYPSQEGGCNGRGNGN